MIVKHYDEENHFISTFNTTSGFYLRTSVLDENGKDTGVEPFMASYPELLDIGIMQTCVCAKHCNVDCYQKAINRTGNNMGLKDFESILKQSTGKIFQCALGGAGDVDTHENFDEIANEVFARTDELFQKEYRKAIEDKGKRRAISVIGFIKSGLSFAPHLSMLISAIDLFMSGFGILKSLDNKPTVIERIYIRDKEN